MRRSSCSVERDWPAADAAFLKAAQLAQQRYLVEPATEDYRITYLVTALELAKRQEGYDRPLTAAATPIVAGGGTGGHRGVGEGPGPGAGREAVRRRDRGR